MTVTTPPRRPVTEQDRDLEQRVAELEALIEEARRRARRRRRIYAAIALTALGAAAWASFDIGGGGVSLGRSASGDPSASAAQSGSARWRSFRGPEGGYVFAVAIDPADSKIVYAGSWGNVFKSTDEGASWKDVSDEPWTRVAALAIDPTQPSVVYAGTDRGLAKTTDGGRHWRMINTGLFGGKALPPRVAIPAESVIGSLTIDAQHPATVYATTGLGLSRTTNGGARWQIIGPAVLRNPICLSCVRPFLGYPLSFAIDPNHAQTIYASGARAAGLIYESADGGNSWRRITVSPAHSFSSLALTASGTLLGTDQLLRGVYRSTDGGTTWSPSGLPGETLGALTVDPGSGTIYTTTNSGAVFHTTDGGVTWQAAPANFAYGEIVTDPSDPATIYATAADGLVKSVDHGGTWAAADKGIVSTGINALALVPGSPATLYATTWSSGVFKSSDGGRTWRLERSGLGNASVDALAVDPQNWRTLYAVEQGRGLFKSSDAGVHWSRVQTAFPSNGVQAVAIDPQHSGTVYVADCGGVCGAGTFQKTDDRGASWRPITGIPAVQSLAIDPQHPNTVFAGTMRGDIFRSSDGARSWHRVAAAPALPQSHQYAVVAIAIDPRDHDNVYAGRRSHGIVKSSDGGKTWARANAGLTNLDMYALAVDPHNPQVLFASTRGGVFRSGNSGESWQPYGRGLPAGGVAAFAIDPAGRTIYAGTQGDGVVSLRLSG